MCGIAVAIGWPEAETTVRRMIAGIDHRGDVTDPLVSPRADVALCTRRLRIVDPQHAVQPQQSFDGRLLVSLNGQIYNHAALRAELETLGVPFRTASDTEVVANALQVWGPAALKRFIGMFAFVAYDGGTGNLLAARDPMGVKPLYIIQGQDGFLFCSEIRPLLEATDSGDVMLLPPGYLLTKSLCVRYSALPSPPEAELTQADPQALDRIMAEAVSIRMPPELPVAVMFSGGIDSTLVAHYARRIRPETPGYMLGGPDAPDMAYAAHYADRTGFDLRVIPFDPSGAAAFALIDTVVGVVESFEPGVVRNSICSYLVSQRMHEDGFRVALCGEGADELFAGYATLEHVFVQGNAAGRHVQEQCIDAMHRSNLQRVDRASMAFQVETREPLLDPALVAYARGLDASALVRAIDGHPRGKLPLRALYDLYPAQLPAMIRDRQKIPFEQGAGIDAESAGSSWTARFDDVISDRDFRDGQREFAAYELGTKEELHYFRCLARSMDVNRVPHLRGRLKIAVPEGTPGMNPALALRA